MPVNRLISASIASKVPVSVVGLGLVLATAFVPANVVVAKQELRLDKATSGAIHAKQPYTAPSAKLVSIRVTTMDLGTLSTNAFGDLDASQR